MAESLGKAYIEIVPEATGFGKKTSSEIEDELDKVGTNAGKKLSDGIGGAFKAIGATIAAAGIGTFLKGAVDAAGDLAEQSSKVEVVFKDAADQVLEFGENATASMGASKLEALEAAGTFGNLLVATGIATDKAADMSTTMVQLAGDMASFNNVPVAETLQAIQSGLAGETEPLKRFGVNLNEAALKAEAMALGLDTSGSSLNATTKAQAAYSLIMKATAIQQGDFARTSDSLANQQRILAAEFENAKAEIGQALLPAMLSLVQAGRDLVPAFTAIAGSVADLLAVVGPGVGLLGSFLAMFLGSELGTFTVIAGGATVAIVKIGSAAKAAAESIRLMEISSSKLSIAAAGIGLLVGAALSIFNQVKSDAAEASRQQEILAKAFEDTQDPAATLAAKLTDLNKQLDETGAKSGDAAAGLEGFADPFKLVELLGDDVVETLNRIGVSGEEIGKALREGNMAPVLNEAREGYRNLKATMDQVTADKFTSETDKAIDALKDTAENAEKTRETYIETIQAQVQAAVFAGRIGQDWLDNALAMSTATDETGKWIDVGNQLAPILDEQAAAQTKAAAAALAKGDADKEATSIAQQEAAVEKERATAIEGASKRIEDAKSKEADAVADAAVKYGMGWDQAQKLVDIEEEIKQKTEEHTQAEKDLADAYDAARAAQDLYMFQVSGSQVALDTVITGTRDLIKGLGEGAETAGRGTTAFEGLSKAAINNRSAFDEVLQSAEGYIDGLVEAGETSDVVAAKQAALAQQVYEVGIQEGLTEEEAAKLRDTILKIPKEQDTTVQAHEKNVYAITGELKSSERTYNATIAVSLSGVGISQAVMDSVRSQMQANFPGVTVTGRARGGLVHSSPSGSLTWVGEGGNDEAIVPLPPGFLAGIQAIARGQASPGTTVNVSISNGPSSTVEAQALGKVVGETAARVLAHRQIATGLRV